MINWQEKINKLPTSPGVYLYYDADGKVIYVGKAAVLKSRVSSYFMRPHDARIEELVRNIEKIETKPTPSVLEALVLESALIKKYQPKYNVREKDDKSWLYIMITNENFPKPILVRQKNLPPHLRVGVGAGKKLFGPYTSAKELRAALVILRKIFTWSYCQPSIAGKIAKSCFDYKIGLCPGVCVGIHKSDYAKHIRQLVLFLEGKKLQVMRLLKKEMAAASAREDFEAAGKLRNRLRALEHIRDTALLLEPENDQPSLTPYRRIEGYDISNISGTSAVGSMVVFQNNRRAPGFYRKFKIKTIETSNDVGMLKEVLRRRLRHSTSGDKIEYWPEPDILLIDGGKGQVNAALEILKEFNLSIPVIGIAKGAERKKNEFVFGQVDAAVEDWVGKNQKILIAVRDEAHRYAITFHRQLRGRRHF